MKALTAMPLVYVAGPYRGDGREWTIRQNIHNAVIVARELWQMGFSVLCPHANRAFMGGGEIPDEVFLNGDLEMLSRCDAMVILFGWPASRGATVEREFAVAKELPVFQWSSRADRVLLTEWLERWRTETGTGERDGGAA